MKGSTLALFVMTFAHRLGTLIIVILFLTYPTNAQNESNNSWSEKGGYSVIMEQYTATWCDICESVDSWMPEYTEANGNRVIRIALHDSIDDPLGSPITDYRLEKYSDSLVAPSFWFDGSITSGGTPDTTTLHRSLLSAENERRGDTEINLSVVLDSNELIITPQLSNWDQYKDSKVIFLILEDNVVIPKNTNSNGVKVHHDVLFAYNEIHINNSYQWAHPNGSWSELSSQESNLTSKFTLPEDKLLQNIEIVVIHESIATNNSDSKILGALAIHLGEENANSKINIFVPFVVIICISVLPILIQSRQ